MGKKENNEASPVRRDTTCVGASRRGVLVLGSFSLTQRDQQRPKLVEDNCPSVKDNKTLFTIYSLRQIVMKKRD